MMKSSTKSLLNINTQLSLSNRVVSYLGDDDDEFNKYGDAAEEFNLKNIYKFDIGRNCDGFSPLIEGVMNMTNLSEEAIKNLVDYPDNHYRLLKSYLSKLYKIKPESFVMGTGLENIIDILTRILLSENDRYLLPVPNFSLFEEFSSRAGAKPIFVYLKKEDDYQWTSATTDKLIYSIKHDSPKILWISNPINPVGQLISSDEIEKVLKVAEQNNCFVVLDEAYGEYTDQDNSLANGYDLVEKYSNVIILRTLSKIYGLPSIRIGYLACNNPTIIDAIKLYRQYFPFSWYSLYVGQIAIIDQEYVSLSRRLNIERKTRLFKKLDKLSNFEYIKSQTSVFLLKNKNLSAEEMESKLIRRGIFIANHNAISGLKGENFIRITVQDDENNNYLIDELKKL